MDDNAERLNITLLCGGISAEREVSLKSGMGVAAALKRGGHQVFTADISPTNLAALDHQPCDLVFPVLHGEFGEDGGLQEILEKRSIPFVGSGSAASRLAMDKQAAKAVLQQAGIPTPSWQVVRVADFRGGWNPSATIFPCVVKPASEGSSVACRICRNVTEAEAHLRQSLDHYSAMLVEKYIQGPELTIGILDGMPLPIIEIRPKTAFYDYEAKYLRNDTEYNFKINLPPATLEQAATAAVDTYRRVGARHLSRVDVMVDGATGRPYVLEINTLPGFTDHSLLPKAAAEAGINFDTLCHRLAQMAVRDTIAV